MLYRFANNDEQLQPLVDTQPVVIAELSDRNSLDQFHHEVWTTVVRSAGIKHARDVGMIHHRQGLFLGVKPSDHILRVQFRLDEFQGHPTFDRLILFGQPDNPHSAATEFFNQAKIGQDRGNVDR